MSKVKETAKENRKAFKVSKEERGNTEQEVERTCDKDRKACDLSGNKDGGNVVPSSRKRDDVNIRITVRNCQGSCLILKKLKRGQSEGNKNSKMAACFTESGSSGDHATSSSPSANPGPVTMDIQENEKNI